MTPALYQRFRPIAAFREMVARRRIRRDLLAARNAAIEERDAAIEERDAARKEYKRQLEWNVCQSQNIGECHRQIEALRAAAVAMLCAAVAERRVCVCRSGSLTPTCEAWRALGFEGHFDADKAADLLPLVKP